MMMMMIRIRPTATAAVTSLNARHQCRQRATPKVSVRRLSSAPTFQLRLWERYTESLRTHPLWTKCSATALIFFISDTATQYMESKRQHEQQQQHDGDEQESRHYFSYDVARSVSGAVFGVMATGYLHVWWNHLERAVERLIPFAKSKIGHTAVKVCADQLLGAPFYVYSYYFVTNFIRTVSDPLYEGTWNDALDQTKNKANQMFWPTITRHWQLWPAVHSLNFYYVPLQHRVLVQNFVLVGWSGYLSHLNHCGLEAVKVQKEEKVEAARSEVLRTEKRRMTANVLPQA